MGRCLNVLRERANLRSKFQPQPNECHENLGGRGRFTRSLLLPVALFLLATARLTALPLLLGDLDGDNQPTILDLISRTRRRASIGSAFTGRSPCRLRGKESLLVFAELQAHSAKRLRRHA